MLALAIFGFALNSLALVAVLFPGVGRVPPEVRGGVVVFLLGIYFYDAALLADAHGHTWVAGLLVVSGLATHAIERHKSNKRLPLK